MHGGLSDSTKNGACSWCGEYGLPIQRAEAEGVAAHRFSVRSRSRLGRRVAVFTTCFGPRQVFLRSIRRFLQEGNQA